MLCVLWTFYHRLPVLLRSYQKRPDQPGKGTCGCLYKCVLCACARVSVCVCVCACYVCVCVCVAHTTFQGHDNAAICFGRQMRHIFINVNH